MNKKDDESCTPVVKKRGRKSKKELEDRFAEEINQISRSLWFRGNRL